MKLGFIGNMNNYPFMVASQFKKKGYEVLFIITESDKLCRPEFRYNHISTPYPDWIIDFAPLNLDYFLDVEETDEFKKIVSLLNTCDYVFLNGYFIRFSKYLSVKHICAFTGSDLTVLANFKEAEHLFEEWIKQLVKSKTIAENSLELKIVNSKLFFKISFLFFPLLKFKTTDRWFKKKNFIFNLFHLSINKMAIYEEINKQRQSIKKAMGFLYAPLGAVIDGDQLLKEIKVKQERRIVGLMVDERLSEYMPEIPAAKIRLFNVARFNWVKDKKQPADFTQLDFKANDIMIKGIALFYKKHAIPLDIIFVKKGNDIEETIKLTEEVGISHLITWKEVLTQQEVLQEYSLANVVFDQLGDAVVTMGGLEAMAVGRPLIANARAEIYDTLLGSKTEICDSKNEIDVLNWLEKLCLNDAFRIDKGKKSHEFVLKYFSSDSVVNGIIQNIKKYQN